MIASWAARRSTLVLLVSGLFLLAPGSAPGAGSFVTFESGQVRPLALSPDGTRLYAVNTPDNRLEIFGVAPAGLTHLGSVPVGLEPVAVAARTNAEVWVVNHLSDSVSIVDVALSPPRVVRTLLVGDEPRDIVFAGSGGNRAFITAAHRGQNNPNDPQLTTSGVGRADVWVFDAPIVDTTLGGTPAAILTFFGDTPRALAATPNGATVYAAVFHSGNQTTAINEGVVCNGGSAVGPCNILGTTYPGGLPAPNANIPENVTGPETGLIVKFNPSNSHWEDRLGRNWNNAVKFSLPDRDVFALNADTLTPGTVYTTVGTINFNMVVNPVSGRVYVSNTDAHNEVRFEGPGGGGSTVRGHLQEARITVLDGATVTPRHLNKHIDYAVVPSPAGVKEKSLAIPVGMAVSSDGATLYVAAFGSSKVGVFTTAQLEADTFVPNAADHITVTGGGPSGLVLDEANGRLYVLTRFDNAVAVVDTATRLEVDHLPLHNPEPPNVRNGRPFLYDALTTSSNGEASCAACHIFGDFDSLAWDLGNPDDVVVNDPNPKTLPDVVGTSFPDFHPMKGPMTTQSLRGMANNGPMHWRGDRTGGNDPGGDPLDEDAAFKKFNVAFGGLLGRSGPLTAAQMQAFTDFILEVTYPPNPIRSLDNDLTNDQLAGRTFFMGPQPSDVFEPCNGCHVRNEIQGHFGTDGNGSFEFEPQMFKIPHLRNMYQKVGMFGMPRTSFFNAGDNGPKGDQVRGFGFLHDGSVDTLFRFHNATGFNQNNPFGFPITQAGGFPNGAAGDPLRRQVEAFMLVFDTDLHPMVGQQVTLTASNAVAVGPRIDDMIVSAGSSAECDLVVKGTLGVEQRGWVRTAAGTFQIDENGVPPDLDAVIRAQALVPTQERTYTCVPLGSGTRIGVDRDEDGYFDHTEILAGSDPDDPLSLPPGASTSTTTTTATTSTTGTSAPTTTTTFPYVLIQTRSLKLTESTSSSRRVRFRSRTRRDPAANRIVPPTAGSLTDPTLGGATLTVYNSANVTNDHEDVFLPAQGWSARGGGSVYRFRDRTGPVSSVVIRKDSIRIRAGGASFVYTLDEPYQGRVAVRLALGALRWCADAPARVTGYFPSSAQWDRPGRFFAETRTPAPASCPATPGGSPSGAFLEE